MLGQGTARQFVALEALHFHLRARRHQLCRRRGLGGIRLQLGELQLELLQDRTPLRGLPKPLVAQLGDGELHVLNQQRAGACFRFGVPASRVCAQCRRIQPAACRRHVRCGIRQSMPSGVIGDFTDPETPGRLQDICLDPVEIDDIAGRGNHLSLIRAAHV